MAQETQALAGKLQGLQQDRDAALAEAAAARDEARAAAAAQEQALAAAHQAQQQVQAERDAVVASLSDLQRAWGTAQAKRAAELQRLRQVAQEKEREAAELRAALELQAVQLDQLQRSSQQHVAAPAAAAEYAQPPGALQRSRGWSSLESEGGWAAGEPLPLPLQPLRHAPQNNAHASWPAGQTQAGADKREQADGWGAGYLSKFEVGAARDCVHAAPWL